MNYQNYLRPRPWIVTYKFPLLLIGLALFVPWGIVTLVNDIQYDRNIGGHLELAANANQPQTAIAELKTALQGMDRAGITNRTPGQNYTSILWNEPNEDVGFWRLNVEQTWEDLKNLPPDADHLKVSNTLLKVRDSLTEPTQKGVEVTAPAGISRYPHNGIMAAWLTLSSVIFGLGSIGLRLS